MLRSVIFWVSDKCNYRCPYCIVRRLDIPSGFVPAGRWISAFNRFKIPLKIDLTGGEPLLRPDIDEIVDGLGKNHYLAITTNFSIEKPLDFYRKFYAVTLSFHPSMLTDAGEEDFMARAMALAKQHSSVSINFVAAKGQIDRISKLASYFQKAGISFNIDPDYLDTYSENERRFLELFIKSSRAFRLSSNGNKPGPRICSAGSSYIHIFPDSSIKPCSGRDMIKGSFFDNPVPLYRGPEICEVPDCWHCDWDACSMWTKDGELLRAGR